MKWIKIKELNSYKGKSVNPLKEAETVFEMYSVPSYEGKFPEIITGSEIGSTKQKVKKDDVLLCKINPRINRVWVVSQFTENPTIASSEWIVIRNDKMYSKYLMWYFRSEYFRALMNLNVTGMGGSLMRAQPKQVGEYLVPVPVYSIQIKISDVLDKAKEIIEKRKEQIEACDELIKSQFIEMFGDPMKNDRGWSAQPLGELCTIVRGGSPRPIANFLGGNIPWIKIGDATQGEDIYLHSTKEHIIEEGIKKSRYIKAGSLIFANCGVSLGFARIITFDGCIHDGWLAFQDIDENKLDKVFLLKSLNMCTDYFRRTAPDGTQPNLNTDIMKKYVQIMPPIEYQREFVKFTQQLDKLGFEMERYLHELENNFNPLTQLE